MSTDLPVFQNAATAILVVKLSSPATIRAGCAGGLLPRQTDIELPAATQIAELEGQRRSEYPTSLLRGIPVF